MSMATILLWVYLAVAIALVVGLVINLRSTRQWVQDHPYATDEDTQEARAMLNKVDMFHDNWGTNDATVSVFAGLMWPVSAMYALTRSGRR